MKQVILIVLDAVRRDTFYENADSFPSELKKDFVDFRKCESLYSSTALSHYTMFFGNYFNKSKNPSIAFQLNNIGYKSLSYCNGAIFTLYPIKNDVEKAIKMNRPYRDEMIKDFGLKPIFNWKKRNLGSKIIDYTGSADDEEHRIPEKWEKDLREFDKNKLFLFLHFWKAHADYGINNYIKNPIDGETYTEFGRELFKRIKKGQISIELVKRVYSLRIQQILSIHIKRLFEILKEKKVYDDSLIIITSDHGEGLGDIGRDYNDCLFKIYNKCFKYYTSITKKISPALPKTIQNYLEKVKRKLTLYYKFDYHTFFHAGDHPFLKKIPLMVKFPGNEYGGKTLEVKVTLFDIIHTINHQLGNKLDVKNSNGISLYSLISTGDREKSRIKRSIGSLKLKI